MIPLMSLISSASATGAILAMCSGKDRQADRRKPSKSGKSGKSTKSHRSGSKSSRASSRASGTKSHRSSRSGASSSKSRRSSKKGKHGKSTKSKKNTSTPGVVAPGGSSIRQSEEKKSRSEKRSKRSSKSKKEKKCKALQCDPNKVKKESVTSSISSNASSKSGKRQKKIGSGSGSLSGEKSDKALKAVPNNSNYKFPEGQIKASSLRASPNKLPFATTGGVQTVTIANTTKSRKAFKVKTSDNLLYRVNPVFGFVDPGKDFSIDVLRHNGNEKTDHLVILTSDATPGQACAKGLFETDPPRELTVVPLVAN